MSEAVPRGKSRGRVFSACAAGTFVSSAPPARPGPGGPADPGGPAPALSPLVTPPPQPSRACAVSCPGGPHSLLPRPPGTQAGVGLIPVERLGATLVLAFPVVSGETGHSPWFLFLGWDRLPPHLVD